MSGHFFAVALDYYRRRLELQYLVGGEVFYHARKGSFPCHRDRHVVDRLSELRDI
jgi:hypothetical protein